MYKAQISNLVKMNFFEKIVFAMENSTESLVNQNISLSMWIYYFQNQDFWKIFRKFQKDIK